MTEPGTPRWHFANSPDPEMDKIVESSDVVRVVPGLMTTERQPLPVLAFVILLVAAIGATVLLSSQLRNSKAPINVVKVSKQPCDVQLLQHDEVVLDKAYSLAITGRHAAAVAEVAKHYAAMNQKECQ